MGRTIIKLDRRHALRDGTYSVTLGLGHGTNMYISTGVSVREEDWDDRLRMCVGRDAKRKNELLAAVRAQVENVLIDLRLSGRLGRMSREELRAAVTGRECRPRESDTSVSKMFSRVMATKGGRTAEIYSQTLRKLEAFCDVARTGLPDVTRAWLAEFDASMSGLAVNTRAIHMRNLRNVFNFALDEGLITNYPFRRFRIRREETPMRVLPVEQMRYLAGAGHFSRTDAEYRDVFLLMFCLIGINIVDLAGLTRASVRNGRVEYRRAKTRKLYSIKIEPETAALIERLRGERHLVGALDRYGSYRDYAAHLNDALQRLGPLLTDASGVPVRHGNAYRLMSPVEPRLTTYWARYSWATYAAELDVPKDTISEALGHEHGSRVTGIYIKYSRDKVDAANRRVLDYVFGRGGSAG